ncbi:MAG: sel1 repeat family protein [Verrucomicrobia bacterium]|nr:sel1 repeat family protein [Verrucomicrobiota bacterium]
MHGVAAEIPADSEGQYQLGFRYASGRGVPKNMVMAYKWLSMAAAQNHEQAIELKNMISERMTPDQISEAERLATAHVPQREVAY